MRFSLGTARVLGLNNVKVETLPTTAYLMTEGQCSGNCAFCPQAREASSRADLLSRVTWPMVPEDEAVCALSGTKQVKRVCIQVVNTRDWRRKVREFLSRVDLSTLPPLCLSCQPKDLEEIAGWFELGVDRIGIPLDAATPEVHRKVKSGNWHKTMNLLTAAAAAFPGRIGTHLIVGIGERECEAADAMARLYGAGVTVALFAFTPVKGTALQALAPPPLDSYRRLQAARYVLATGQARWPFAYDHAGRLIDWGLPQAELLTVLADGEAFRTSGCPDCNRPYYNERPGGTMYNYPRPLSALEAEEAIRDMDIRPVWRILDTGQNTGAWNMAVDEAIMDAVAEGSSPPTVRLYGWNPPALSLGYFQDRDAEVDPAGCARYGVDVVRRPTGGRAVLHDDELTYSIAVREDDPLIPAGVVESYRVLSEGIRRGLQALGVPVEMVAAAGAGHGVQGPPLKSAACFDAPSQYELAVEGKKLVGSAQVRRGGAVLQHGSILIGIDFDRLVATLAAPNEAVRARLRDNLAKRATAIEDAIGRRPTWSELASALTEGWSESLGVALVPGCLTPEEEAAARRLHDQKYATEDWNAKRPGATA